MAFQQTQHRPPPLRRPSYSSPTPQPAELSAASPQRKRALEESEEWVLFSPSVAAPSTLTRTHTTSTERTPRTAGLSRLSDFGSLDTAAHSDRHGEGQDGETIYGDEEEEGELDSLDDGLHAFHEPSEYSAPIRRLDESDRHPGVLPTHDGLGTFGTNEAIQEHLWQFERYNPRRRLHRRRSSVQKRLDTMQEEQVDEEDERTKRIEKWRMEQSLALLEEVERETRRRRRLSTRNINRNRRDSAHLTETMPTRRSKLAAVTTVSVGAEGAEEANERENFWQRFTKRIRDLIGIDEDLLSVIFGEALPEEIRAQGPSTSTTLSLPEVPEGQELTTYDVQNWEYKLLQRIARELGIIVNQLSEHPGAFTTYLRTQEPSLYAGLSGTNIDNLNPISTSTASFNNINTSSPISTTTAHLFAPTLTASPPLVNEVSHWGIDTDPTPDLDSTPKNPSPLANHAARDMETERAYWEKDFDVKMVFSFLVNRFSSRPPSSSSLSSTTTPSAPRHTIPVTVAQVKRVEEAGRRAQMIRRLHPLANELENENEYRTSTSAREQLQSASGNVNKKHRYTPMMPTSRSSCASQSTRKSKSKGSSRHYWDLAGSARTVGTESAVGVWGEV
ncbi:hypothetical protein M501DRAFT_1020446 [Patellaria atrata CBS 101060]|uniref:Uncharacterized protein n=1 Tax=Patellaria atrata CBS 101060 TaxID=1346257 RepID=A0A9P4S249_9PEZI|nr:hypothetical protein M501DRAFT_1020446 [Patellaria atrata CBS 101060]